LNTTALLHDSGIIDFLGKYSGYYIVGHKEPDGDCIGSQLALGAFLSRQGKKVMLLSSGPFSRTEIATFAVDFVDTLGGSALDVASSAIIVVDCSSLSRIGSVADCLPSGLPLAFIDHHASGEASGDVRFVDPMAPAVTYLVQGIIEAFDAPTRQEAEYLLFGLCTDTGFFRHLDERSGDVFAAVGRLVAAAQPHGVGRHRLGGVLVQQRGERVDVVPLERVEVAGEQFVTGPIRGRRAELDDLEIATAEWVDWFNHRRPFEYCDDLTPAEAEAAHYAHHQTPAVAGVSN